MPRHIGAAKAAVRSRLAQLDKTDAKLFKNARCLAENARRIGIVATLGCAIGGQPDRNTVRAPHRDKPLQHLAHEAGAVLHRAAILIFAQIGIAAQKLINQIAVGAVELNPIETRRLGVFCGVAIIFDHAGNFRHTQCMGLLVRLASRWRMGMIRRSRCRSRNARLAAEEIGMNQPAHMPQLQDDPAASGVHCCGHQLPACNLRIGPDPRSRRPAKSFYADPGCFTDDQPGPGALAVIVRHHRSGDETGIGAPAGQWGHHDAIGRVNRAKLDRLEQFFVHAGLSLQFRFAI